MAVSYNTIPSLQTWKTDSSVTFATRANDTVLSRIDELVDAYNRAADDGARIYIASDLFFTLDYWLKVYKTSSGMEKGREPAVMALYKCVVDQLGYSFGQVFNSGQTITPNNLPAALESFFGREMGAHGTKLDLRLDCAQYLSRAEVAKYRITFKNGLAYQFPWWQRSAKPGTVVRADSSRAENPAVLGRDKWGGFAMSMGRDLYLAKHHCTMNFGETGNFYHSSYLGGQPVMCAGTMLIENGVVRGIATDSGHYRPDKSHIVNVLQALRMHGVDLSRVDVLDHDEIFQAKGDVFLAANGNWAAMAKRRQLNETHIKSRRADEKAFGDAIKTMWDQGVRGGFYTDDMSGKLYFVTHVLPLRKKIGGFDTEGLNFLYALDALAKAASRGADPKNDWNAWCVNQWRSYLKGDTGTNRDGMPNKRTTVPSFVLWLKGKPEFSGWTPSQVNTWVEDVFKQTAHRFDA